MNVNCPRDPMTCHCHYHQGYVEAAPPARMEVNGRMATFSQVAPTQVMVAFDDTSPPPAEEFVEFQDPAITWYVGEAYSSAFRDMLDDPAPDVSGHQLREDQIMAEFTNPLDPVSGSALYPAFVAIRFEGDRAILTVRGDPERAEDDTPTALGETVTMTMLRSDWEQFQSWATRDSGLPSG